VLQIFIEKIVQAIESFAHKLKALTRDELQLWEEEGQLDEDSPDEANLNELNYSINGIDLNLIFKMQSMYQPTIADGLKQGLLDGLQEESKDKDSNV